jgi:hypothetical protein
MKKITYKTILKQGDNEFQPCFTENNDKVFYWVNQNQHITESFLSTPVWSVRYAKPIIFGEHENSYLDECFEIVAQSEPILEGIPVIVLDSSSPNQYTKEDIIKAYKLSRKSLVGMSNGTVSCNIDDLLSLEEIFEKLNLISVIEVDKQFNIIKIS